MSDPIADMLTLIRNANTAKHNTVDIPSSRVKVDIANILIREGYAKGFEILEDGPKKTIRLTLKYGKDKNEKVIAGIKRISKPGLRVYARATALPTQGPPARPRSPRGIDWLSRRPPGGCMALVAGLGWAGQQEQGKRQSCPVYTP
jgi:small subunit ribosomal protein S8